MESIVGNPRSTADVKQLKLQIMQMKREIARKRRKLQKCKQATEKRKNSINESEENTSKTSSETSPSFCGRDDPGSPEIGLMGVQRLTLRLDFANLNANSALENSLSERELDVEQMQPVFKKQERDNDQNTEEEPVTNQNEASAVTSPEDSKPSIQATNPAILRRSSRISYDTRLITSGEYVGVPNVSKRASIKASSVECVKKKSVKKRNASIFPEFPASQMGFDSSCDFDLPDVDFARLKLNVNKSRTYLNGNSINARSGAELTDEDDDDDMCRMKLIGGLPSTARRNEPIMFVHCGQLKLVPAVILSVIITVQPRFTSTWARTSSNGDNSGTDWCLLKTSRRDMQNCHKTNMHGVQSSDLVASICIMASKDKQRLTFCINSCDALQRVILRSVTVKPDFHMTTGLLLSCCAWSGAANTCEVGLANVWARASRLHYVQLDDSVRNVANERRFHEADDNLNVLLNIDGLDEALLGMSSSVLYIWHKGSGQIVKTVEIKGAMFRWVSCIFCSSNKGLLYLGMLAAEYGTQECSLVAVNPNTAVWRTIGSFTFNSSPSPRSHRSRRAQSQEHYDINPTSHVRKHGNFLICLQGTSTIYIWKATTGEQVARFANGQFDEVTAYECSHLPETLIFVANQYEDVTIYSAD